MIFVTVGTQLSFERLVNAVDDWARRRDRHDVFAQIGPSAEPPSFIDHAAFLEPSDIERRFDEARLIVAHAGMGTILGALARRKPILVLPRLASLREQRNDHQLATVERFSARGLVHAAHSPEELVEHLDASEHLIAGEAIGAHAAPELLARIRTFISGGEAA